jgi:acyl carrier protein
VIDFIELLNKVARVARPAHHEFVPIQSMDERFEHGSLDSLDMLMVAMYMAEIYGIDDEVAKDLQPETVQQMLDVINEHKTKDPESVEAAVEMIK